MARLKIKGSSLVESIVSLVILMIVATGFLATISAIQKAYNPIFLTKTYFIFLNDINNPREISDQKDDITEYENCYTTKTLSPCNNSKDLVIYSVNLFDNTDRLIYSRSRYLNLDDLNEDNGKE